MEKIASLSFELAFLTLLVIIFLRAQATYWLGRLGATWASNGTAGQTGWKGKVNSWLDHTAVAGGLSAVERWGLIIIPLSFFTWGFQTVVNAAAGVMRLQWWLYTLVAFPGYLAWAGLYSTIGMAALRAVSAASEQRNIFALGTLLVAALCIVFVVVRRQRRRRQLES